MDKPNTVRREGISLAYYNTAWKPKTNIAIKGNLKLDILLLDEVVDGNVSPESHCRLYQALKRSGGGWWELAFRFLQSATSPLEVTK